MVIPYTRKSFWSNNQNFALDRDCVQLELHLLIKKLETMENYKEKNRKL